MSDLVEFAKEVEDKLRIASREPQWRAGEAERYMLETDSRRQRFEEIAVRLGDNVIRPRLEIIATHFINANLVRDEPLGHCACRFDYCERFPVNVRLSLAVEHDVGFEDLAVCYAATMTPRFFTFNECDRLTLTLDESDDDSVAAWVEQRLCEFLDSYLRLDRGREDFEDEVVTDPVCGMRINRSAAVASEVYRGYPYFFCSADCQRAFVREPTEYVKADPTFGEE